MEDIDEVDKWPKCPSELQSDLDEVLIKLMSFVDFAEIGQVPSKKLIDSAKEILYRHPLFRKDPK